MANGGSGWGAFPVLRWLFEKLAEQRELTSSEIGIHVPVKPVAPEIKFGLFHVRDGNEQVATQVAPLKRMVTLTPNFCM